MGNNKNMQSAEVQLIHIGVEEISSHPDNPRKDLGDLTELAESIKVNGILQNLTVVKGHHLSDNEWSEATKQYSASPSEELRRLLNGRWSDDGYTAVIGHRRLAAAKLAGVKKVPCVVSDMNRTEQLRTMLMENIQRADLTVYEQAQGFQLMLDLGDTVEDVAKETGFSTSTIVRRVKLLALDRDKFKESETRGATLADYAQLDKLSSEERKNKVLDAVGTANFHAELNKAIQEEETEERKNELIRQVSTFATQVDSTQDFRVVRYLNPHTNNAVERPSDADTTEYFFAVESYWVCLLTQKKDDEGSTEDAETLRQRALLESRRTQLDEASDRARALRSAFVEGVSVTRIRKHMAEILTYYLEEAGGSGCYGLTSRLLARLREDEGTEDKGESIDLSEVIAKCPEKALLEMAFCVSNSERWDMYCTLYPKPVHRPDKHLDNLYEFLKALGYQMSDEEKQLQEGTHPLFCEDETEDATTA